VLGEAVFVGCAAAPALDGAAPEPAVAVVAAVALVEGEGAPSAALSESPQADAPMTKRQEKKQNARVLL
jgi:hypothetical protein